ncbi:MAG: DUF2862 domain-containing protein [Gloeomargaritaceae cyanobacterium C42_A2020_066]|nr:DUF2862 domain-containing protein [Gloeomargaritaceae cyanobacterium C42_A2020_066]
MRVGQKVRVCCLKDRVASDISQRLGQVGRVSDYRVVDGKGIGLVVQFDDKNSIWFFPEELEPMHTAS